MKLVRLREARVSQGLTQAELAKRTGLQPCAIAHFEAGRRTPSMANFIRLVNALGCSADWMLKRKGAKGDE